MFYWVFGLFSSCWYSGVSCLCQIFWLIILMILWWMMFCLLIRQVFGVLYMFRFRFRVLLVLLMFSRQGLCSLFSYLMVVVLLFLQLILQIIMFCLVSWVSFGCLIWYDGYQVFQMLISVGLFLRLVLVRCWVGFCMLGRLKVGNGLLISVEGSLLGFSQRLWKRNIVMIRKIFSGSSRIVCFKIQVF